MSAVVQQFYMNYDATAEDVREFEALLTEARNGLEQYRVPLITSPSAMLEDCNTDDTTVKSEEDPPTFQDDISAYMELEQSIMEIYVPTAECIEEDGKCGEIPALVRRTTEETIEELCMPITDPQTGGTSYQESQDSDSSAEINGSVKKGEEEITAEVPLTPANWLYKARNTGAYDGSGVPDLSLRLH